MKISGGWDETMPTHWRNHFRDCPAVKLDGCVVEHVTEADDEAGYLVVVCYGPDGKMMIDETGQELVHERHVGIVEIIGDRIAPSSDDEAAA